MLDERLEVGRHHLGRDQHPAERVGPREHRFEDGRRQLHRRLADGAEEILDPMGEVAVATSASVFSSPPAAIASSVVLRSAISSPSAVTASRRPVTGAAATPSTIFSMVDASADTPGNPLRPAAPLSRWVSTRSDSM